jgi:hypothetical protein
MPDTPADDAPAQTDNEPQSVPDQKPATSGTGDAPSDGSLESMARVHRAIVRSIELRESDVLPDPGTLSVGSLCWLVDEVERLHQLSPTRNGWERGALTGQDRERLKRRLRVMDQAPGFAELRKYLNKRGEHVTPAAVQEFRRALCNNLDRDFGGVELMSLTDAVAAVEAPAVAVATLAASGEKGPANKRIKGPEIEKKVSGHLRRHPDASVRDIATAEGLSTGAVTKSEAWRIRQAEKRSDKRSSGRSPKTIPLTEPMLANMPADAQDPDGPGREGEQAEVREMTSRERDDEILRLAAEQRKDDRSRGFR